MSRPDREPADDDLCICNHTLDWHRPPNPAAGDPGGCNHNDDSIPRDCSAAPCPCPVFILRRTAAADRMAERLTSAINILADAPRNAGLPTMRRIAVALNLPAADAAAADKVVKAA